MVFAATPWGQPPRFWLPQLETTSPPPDSFSETFTWPFGASAGNCCWVTKCDLLEKIKLTFDREGIQVAPAQVDVYHHGEREAPNMGEFETEEWS